MLKPAERVDQCADSREQGSCIANVFGKHLSLGGVKVVTLPTWQDIGQRILVRSVSAYMDRIGLRTRHESQQWWRMY
jgi:hypothetical protein